MCARRATGGLRIRPRALTSAVVPGAALTHCTSKLPVHSGPLPPRQLPGAQHTCPIPKHENESTECTPLPPLPPHQLLGAHRRADWRAAHRRLLHLPSLCRWVCGASHCKHPFFHPPFTACGWKGSPPSCHANACCVDELPHIGVGLCKPLMCIPLPRRPRLQARWQRGAGRQRRGRRACGRSWGSCSTASSSSHRFVYWMACCWLLDGVGQSEPLRDRRQQLMQLI